ncbi:MAG: hypothetical protein PHE49_00385 [bacterium]|nr:hypothetical protein [bacterium]
MKYNKKMLKNFYNEWNTDTMKNADNIKKIILQICSNVIIFYNKLKNNIVF